MLKANDNRKPERPVYDSILLVGPAKFTGGGFISVGFYPNDEIALIIRATDGSGEREAVATCSLEGYDAPPAGPYHVWLKGWSENEGIPEAMQTAGLVQLTNIKYPLPFTEAILARVLEPLEAVIRNAMAQEAA